jgi:hypothetical protein
MLFLQRILLSILNTLFKIDFRKKTPAFKKENPGLRWRTTRDSVTRSNTQVNQEIEIPSVTLAAEVATFLGLIKKTGHRDQQLGPVVDSGASHHAGNCHRDVLTFLPTSFLMYPAIGVACDHASSSPMGANYDTCGHNTSSPTSWIRCVWPHHVWMP